MPAFVPGFKYDIFVSYAHADNAVEIDSDKGWITKFHATLLNKLTGLIGRRENFEVFLDPKIRGLDDHDITIGEALKSSALMVMVLSPAWLASTYCVDELNQFWQASLAGSGPMVGEGCRVIKIGYDQLEREKHPEKVRKFSGYPFFEYHKDTGAVTRFRRTLEQDSDQRYWQQIDLLARHLHQVLLQMVPQPPETALPATAPAVFLAEVTDDIRELGYREQLVQELKQQGIRVLREPLNGHPPSQFDTAVTAQIQKAALSLHCLGQFYGRAVADDDARSEIHFQYEVAHRQPKPRIVWIPKDVPAPKAGTRQAQFIEALENEVKPQSSPAVELIRSGIEELKELVIRRVRPEPPPTPATQGPTRFHVSCTPGDASELAALRTMVTAAGHEMFPDSLDWSDPNRFEQNLEKFRKRLERCDAFMILDVTAPEDAVAELAWTAQEIVESRVKNPLRIKSVYAGPPKASGPGFSFNNWVIFDGTKQAGSLAAFWQQIQQRLT